MTANARYFFCAFRAMSSAAFCAMFDFMDQGSADSQTYAPPPPLWAALIAAGLAGWLLLGPVALLPVLLIATLIYPVSSDRRPSARDREVGWEPASPWWKARDARQWEDAWKRVGIAAVLMLALIGLATLVQGITDN